MRSTFLFGVLLVASCGPHRVAGPPPPAPPRAPPPAPRFYRVQPKENLYRIAQRWGVTVDAIAKVNDLDDPTKIAVGQTIVIPSDARVPTEDLARSAADAPPTKDPLEHPAPPPVGACGDAPRADAKPSKSGWIWPVDGVVVERKDGIEIAAPQGTPIWAARAGVVVFAGEQEGYGTLVILQHDGDRVSIYAHNAKNCVAEGTRVAAGDVVGLVGISGGSASPEVHFEVRQGQKVVNPRVLLP